MVLHKDLDPEVIKMCRPLILEDDVLKKLVAKFSEYLKKSLKKETARHTPVKAKLTYVDVFPNGEEFGNVIGLDFSGRTFRLVHCNFNAGRECAVDSRLYELPEHRLLGPGHKMIEYVAKCVSHFLDTTNIKEEKLCLGVSLSFPVVQDNLQHAVLSKWTAGIRCDDYIGADIFLQLKMALKQFQNTKRMYLIGVVTDATACLLSGLYNDPSTKIGLIVGSDINICYVEKYKNMTIASGDAVTFQTALNLSIRNFGDDGCLDFIKSDFDVEVDAHSTNPDEYTFDKMVSASYLGELCRLALIHAIDTGVILNGKVSDQLATANILTVDDIALMESDRERVFVKCKIVMSSLGYHEVSDQDCLQIRFICRCVGRRSCNLIAACMTALIDRMELRNVSIIADGCLIKDFPRYNKYLNRKIYQLRKPDVRFTISLTENEDVGMGAGLLAAIYRDGTIKIEDKFRALPRFNVERCSYLQTGVPCKNCKCMPKQSCFGKCGEEFPKRETCRKV